MSWHRITVALGLFAVLMASMLVLGADGVYAADTLSKPDTTDAVGRWSSITLDDNKNPVVAYYDATNQDLKVLHCGNTACSSGNNIETISGTGTVANWSIAIQLDGDGYPLVAFSTTDYKLKLLHCGDEDCSSGNSINVIDDAATYGTGHYIGFFLSMVLDGDGYPAISYQHAVPTFYLYTPKIARCDDVGCSDPTVTLLDESELAIRSGFGNSLALDSDGYPVISFTDTDVWLLHCDSVDCSGTNSVEDIGDSAGALTSNKSLETALVLDSSGYPVIAFQDDNLHLRVVHCNDVDCDGGDESDVEVDDIGPVGMYVSMVLDDGIPVIAYHSHTFGDLKILRCGNANCTSGNTIKTVERPDHAGAYTSIRLNPSNDRPVISHNYQDVEDLGVAVCNSTSCDGLDVDTDQDGCTDAQEDAMDPPLDPDDPSDFFDTPDQNGHRDREVDSVDVQRVLDRVGTSGDPDGDRFAPPPDTTSYHPAFDTQGDGQITLFGDVVPVINQAGLDCN